MTAYRLTEEQKEFLKALARKRDQRYRQEENLKNTKTTIQQLVLEGAAMGIAPARLAAAAGYTVARISQMRRNADG